MTTDLPDPHACPHCGHNGLATRWGETICGMCNAPRATATPGCPVRNAMAKESSGSWRKARGCLTADWTPESVAEETARERKVHGGGPRVITHDLDTGETWGGR